MDIFDLPSLSSLWLFALFGIVVGLAGLLFNLALIGTLKQLDKLTSRQKSLLCLSVGFLLDIWRIYYPSQCRWRIQIIHQSLSYVTRFWFLCVVIGNTIY